MKVKWMFDAFYENSKLRKVMICYTIQESDYDYINNKCA